ncbi:unnamed protein product [Effrenium voratum]|nr:unnamed protein product [Effrenium voratum]
MMYAQLALACEPETWDYVQYLDEVAAVNPLPREGRELLYDIFKTAPAGTQCAGMAAVMLHSLAYVDRDQGESAALEVYKEAVKLSGSDAWRVNLSWHDSAPKLLGLDPPADAAMCGRRTSLRFFVYDTGIYSKPVLLCASGMEGSEVLLHRWLLRSACRTLDAHAADFFYVPFYSFCFQNLNIQPGKETEELDRHNVALVKSLEHFDVYRRRQHIFHFAHEFWDFPSWEAHVARSKIFAVEANPLMDVIQYRHCTSCFDERKDVVVPGHTDLWAMRRLREQSRPAEHRRFLFCFHGALRHELYEKTHAEGFNVSAAETRRQIRALASEPDASIGPHITPLLDYYQRVGDCRFCLVPKGVGFTNGRLFEAFFAGCIPVILSDAMLVPFGFLPWHEFSLKLPMGDLAGAVARLRSLPLAKVQDMQEQLLAHACWFDYYSHDPRCSPYQGLLKVLQAQRPPAPAMFW